MRKNRKTPKKDGLKAISESAESGVFPFAQIKTPEFKKKKKGFGFSFGFFDGDDGDDEELFPKKGK